MKYNTKNYKIRKLKNGKIIKTMNKEKNKNKN